MTDRPTPETDTAARRTTVGDATRYVVSREFAERMERQLAELTERVAKWRDMTPEELRLRAGDMTAQEIRSVKAVLNAILPRLVLPLDRDGADSNNPNGHPASNEDCTPARLSQSGKSVWVNNECHRIDGQRFHWQNTPALPPTVGSGESSNETAP